MKTFIIDTRNIINSIHRDWNGEGSFIRHLNKKSTKQYIASIIQNIIGDTFNNATWNFNNKDRELKIIFEWDEQENINVWNKEINNKIRNAMDQLIKKDIISYY